LRLAKQSQFIPLQNVVYFIKLLFWFVKYSHFTQMMFYYLNVHFQVQRVKVHILIAICILRNKTKHRCDSHSINVWNCEFTYLCGLLCRVSIIFIMDIISDML